MTRTAALAAEQRDRLKRLHARQRAALAALAGAELEQARAEQAAADAQQTVKDRKAQTDAAYRALAELVGAASAAELAGRASDPRRSGHAPAAKPQLHAPRDHDVGR